MSTQNGRYGPAFKFKVVLEALRAEGRGVEAEVARAYGIHPVTLSTWKRQFPRAWTGGVRGQGGGQDLRETDR